MVNDFQSSMIRDQFPVLSQQVNGQPLIYFDNAATTQKPLAVIDAVNQYYQHNNANVHRASHALSASATTQFEQARTTVAKFINAASYKEIVWTRGTTEGINLVAHSYGSKLGKGDEIILSTQEHHANIVPWQMLSQRNGVKLRIIPLLESGELDQVAYEELLGEKTKLVAITHASNALGIINPIHQMTAKAHAVGAKVLVDGAQAVAHMPVDVQTLNADFYLFSGHKMFAPTGIGVLYAKAELLEVMPPWQGGGEMIEHVSFDETSYAQPPFKFEAGTPNISGAIGLAAAVDWLNTLNRDALAQHEKALIQHAISGCSSIKGLKHIGQAEHHVSLLSFTLDHAHQQDIGILLDQKGIAVRTGHHCAMPLMQALGLNGTTRASFSIYNTLDEVNHFIECLDQLTRPVQAGMSITTQKQHERLSDTLMGLKGWNERYRQIMLAGKAAKNLPEKDKTPANLVPGCESKTWLISHCDAQGIFTFSADSEARIMKGLLTLILEHFNHKNAADIQQTDIQQIFKQLELEKHLSPSRGNGINSVIERIYTLAEQA